MQRPQKTHLEVSVIIHFANEQSFEQFQWFLNSIHRPQEEIKYTFTFHKECATTYPVPIKLINFLSRQC